MSTQEAIDYMQPEVPGSLPRYNVPLVKATNENLGGYGYLVDNYENHPIENVFRFFKTQNTRL